MKIVSTSWAFDTKTKILRWLGLLDLQKPFTRLRDQIQETPSRKFRNFEKTQASSIQNWKTQIKNIQSFTLKVSKIKYQMKNWYIFVATILFITVPRCWLILLSTTKKLFVTIIIFFEYVNNSKNSQFWYTITIRDSKGISRAMDSKIGFFFYIICSPGMCRIW